MEAYIIGNLISNVIGFIIALTFGIGFMCGCLWCKWINP